MIIYIGRSSRFPDIQPWNVTATGFRLEDTYQVAARMVLRHLCQIYERHLDHTPMRYYPPVNRNRLVWLARLRNLQGRGQREDDPTVLHMAAYLHTLDELYDKQHAKLRQQIRRAEDAEVMVRRLQVKLAAAEARAAAAQSNEAVAIEALKEAEERHSKEIKDAHLVGRARRRMQTIEDGEALALDEIPIINGSGKRKSPDAPRAPPPTEVSREVSELEISEDEDLPLTQPPPKDIGHSSLVPLGDPLTAEE
ncbi:unnamed protein product [Urochloa humidicola]